MKVLYLKEKEMGISYDSHLVLVFRKKDKENKVEWIRTYSTKEKIRGTYELWVPRKDFGKAYAMAYAVFFPKSKSKLKNKYNKDQLRLF